MEQIMNYVKPELIVVAIVLYFVGMGLKKAEAVADKYIPHSNTSHVILYLPLACCEPDLTAHSNTSHVILYPSAKPQTHYFRMKFKYISCYSLSAQFWSMLVTNVKFKYISCYSLSEQVEVALKRIFSFKYISCYSLS